MGKTEKIVFGLFALIGAILIIVGIIMQKNNSEFLETAESTNAEITDIATSHDSDGDVHHSVFVKFEVDGETYEGQLGQYDSGMYVGKEVTVYYNPDNPHNFKGSNSGFVGYFMIIFASIFFLIGIIPLFLSGKKSKKNNAIKQTGTLINAEIDNVFLDTSYRVNGRCGYKLTAHATLPNSDKIYTFESNRTWSNIKAAIETHSITTVPVYVDLNDTTQYYVDLEQITSYLGN